MKAFYLAWSAPRVPSAKSPDNQILQTPSAGLIMEQKNPFPSGIDRLAHRRTSRAAPSGLKTVPFGHFSYCSIRAESRINTDGTQPASPEVGAIGTPTAAPLEQRVDRKMRSPSGAGGGSLGWVIQQSRSLEHPME